MKYLIKKSALKTINIFSVFNIVRQPIPFLWTPHFTLISPLPPQRQFQKRTTNKLLKNGLRTFALGKEPFAVRPQSDKAGALPAPSRIVLRKVISLKMSVYERDHSDRRRERFAWRLTQSAVDEKNVTAVARSAIKNGGTGEVVDKYDNRGTQRGYSST